jgi:hypothetical protein
MEIRSKLDDQNMTEFFSKFIKSIRQVVAPRRKHQSKISTGEFQSNVSILKPFSIIFPITLT